MRITIPTNLNEITLNQYLHFRKIAREHPDNEEYLRLALVTIFCNLTIEQARQIDIDDYNDIVNQLTETLQQKPKFVNRFTLNGVEYGFIPNLDKISAGEYIDLDTYLSDEATYYEAMAVCYRPIQGKFSGGLYNIEKYESAEKHKQALITMPLGIALGTLVFFSTLSRDLLAATRDYLHRKEVQTLLQELTSPRNGDGMQALTQSLLAAESILSERLNSIYIPSSPISSTV